MTNKADRKAQIAASRASARRNPEPMLVDEPTAGGFQFWQVGDVLVGMPKLLPNAPASIRRHYRVRIVANATGECPRCGSIAADTLEGHHASLSHNAGCPLLLGNIERWLDPRSKALRSAIDRGLRGAA
jgi:hypothetical protein